MKLSTKLNVSFLLLLFVPLCTAIFWLSEHYSRELKEESRARLRANRKVAQLLLRHTIESFRNLAAAEVNHQGLALLVEYKLPHKAREQLERIRRADQLDAISILPEQEALRQIYPHEALARNRAVAGLEMLGTEPFVTAAVPVRNKHDRLLGVLQIRKTLEQTGVLKLIAHETGADLRLTPGTEAPAAEDLVETLLLKDIQETQFAVLMLRHAPQHELLTQRLTFAGVLLGGLGTLLLALGLHQYLLRTIIRPLVSLTQMADALRRGKYETRVPVTGVDEIGKLAEHFNRMAEQVQTAWQQCKRLNENLETRVEHRTAELHASNSSLQETIEALNRSQERLIAQEKLAGLGEISAGIAHELKNPLNLIHQFSHVLATLLDDLDTELAKEEPDQTELDYIYSHLPECTAKIREHNQRAVRTVNTMLEHSRGSGGIRRPVDLNQLVKEAVSLAYHGMRGQESGVRISLQERYTPSLDGNPVPVFPGDLSRALLNIAANACQEVSRKSRSAGADYVPGLWIATKEDEHVVRIRIRDNGDGIAEEDRVKIFQPFFSRKAPGEGTGLGLSIAHEIIVKLHRGRLDVDSRPGEWTEFSIELPVQDGATLQHSDSY